MNLKDLLNKAKITSPRIVQVRGVDYKSNRILLDVSETNNGNFNTKTLGEYQGNNFSNPNISAMEPLILTPIVDPHSPSVVMGCWTKMAEKAGLTHDEIDFMKKSLPVWTTSIVRLNGEIQTEYSILHQFIINTSKTFDLSSWEQALEYHMIKWYLPPSEEIARNDSRPYYLSDEQKEAEKSNNRYEVFKQLNTIWKEANVSTKYNAMLVYLYASSDVADNASSFLDMSLATVELQAEEVIWGNNVNAATLLLSILNKSDLSYRSKAIIAISLGIVVKDMMSGSYKLKDGTLLGGTLDEYVQSYTSAHKNAIEKMIVAAINGLGKDVFEHNKMVKDELLSYIQGVEFTPEQPPTKKTK